MNMYNNFNYPYPAMGFPQQQLPSQNGIKGRPVSSIEEAKAANIDFDGSLFLFPDITNQKIYGKQFNSNGSVTFTTYTLTQEPEEEKKEYVTKQEFDAGMAEIKSLLPQKKEVINF